VKIYADFEYEAYKRAKALDVDRWYAMSSPYRSELKSKQLLDKYGVASYLAVQTKPMEVRGKVVDKQVPLVSNLIFIHSRERIINDVKQRIPHLQYRVNYRNNGESYKIVIRDRDMEDFIKVTTEAADSLELVSPDDAAIKEGTRIQVMSGTLKGLRGSFVQFRGGRPPMVVVSLDGLVAVAVMIPRSQIRPLTVEEKLEEAEYSK